MSEVNSHLEATSTAELRGFGYTKHVDVASAGVGRPGEIADIAGTLHFWDSTQWIPWAGGATQKMWRQQITGRMYCYTDNRWVTACDDNYGFAYYQWAESGGTGVTPIYEWEHQGIIMLPGTKVDSMTIMSRATNTEITDIQLNLVKVEPSTPGRWEDVGVDNDAEIVTSVIHDDMFYNPVSGTAMTGNLNDRHARTIDLTTAPNNTFTDLGEMRIYFKPTGTITATRYMQTSIVFQFSET